MTKDPRERLRKLCLSLPDAQEVEAWGAPTFRVNNKIFTIQAGPDDQRGYRRASAWCKAKPMTQDMLLRAEPDRYFAPPYVGPKGWIGIWFDGSTDWATLAALVRDAYILTAPKRLLVRMDDGPDE